ncbi:MAG: ribonuclease III family protein [Silvanigrellaceae bacterium]|nr:ribonuclease III family protein [Silvanigrellaceae bacterium]
MWDLRLEILKSSFESLNLLKLKKIFPTVEQNIEKLCRIQNHNYKDINIAAIALLHRSALVYWPVNKDGIISNEKLEFLGDAFLNFFVASEAMIAHPKLNEGELSRLRAAIVGTENLATKSREYGIAECLFVGKAEVNMNPQKRESVQADAFEAVTAALLLDAGEECARKWALQVFSSDLMVGLETLKHYDAKSRLQQWTQAIIGVPPSYKVIGTEGTPKETFFIVAGFIGNTEMERAIGISKREASKKVAEKIIQKIDSGEITKEIILNSIGK